ncbi:MAG: LytR/AlgR family response regulator transcription factor [Rhodanobacteraceae bacterium]
MAVAILFAAYTATLYVANHLHIGLAVLGGLANTIPVVLFGCGARWLIVRHLIGRSRLRQVVGHLCFGIVFSLLALWLLIILLGMMSDLSTVHFTVVPFTTRGNAWQLLENVTTYAAIAMLSYMQVWQRAVSTVSERAPQVAEKPQRPSDVSRHFIRRGEDILPVDLDRIVCVTGADDYAEVSTLDQTYLVKVTLTEFIRVLEPAKFLRIHRSSIVNLERINRAESAGGGRMLVHMTNGRTIKTSRAGSHLLRTRII